MASETRKRLDEQFPFNPNTEVLRSLREFTRAVEARLAPLDAQSQNYADAVEEVRQIAIARLNEVLLPVYNEFQELLTAGIPSSRLLDARAFGRSLLATPTRDEFAALADLSLADIDLQGGVFLSPELRGATADSPPVGDNTARVPTTAWVRASIAALVNGSPAALDTLAELAAALGGDANFAASMATALGLKAPLASPAFTGVPTGPSAAAGRNDSMLANTNFVTTALALKANLASPALTGTPTAPTAAAGTNTTQIATTAFVQAVVAALVNGSPAALDTLQELAAALGNDANFATTTATALGNRLRYDAAQSLNAAQVTQVLTNAGIGLAGLRSFLTAADLPTARSQIGLGAGSDVNFKDILASRNDGTGVIFLNGARDRFLYYDGSRYVAPGSDLVLNNTPVLQALATKRSRNFLINGAFDIWQRGTSVVSGYAADRWFTNVNTGAPTFSRFQIPDTAYALCKARYGMRIQNPSIDTANTSAFALTGQHVEDVRALAGRRVHLTFKALRLASNTPDIVGIAVYQTFGTGGSPSPRRLVAVTQAALPAVNTLGEVQAFIDILEITGQTIGSARNGTTEFHLILAGGSQYFTNIGYPAGLPALGVKPVDIVITEVQIAVVPAGSTVPVPYQPQPADIELLRCKRFYQRGIVSVLGTTVGADQIVSSSQQFVPEMAYQPSMTYTPFYESFVKTRSCDAYDERAFRTFISTTQGAGNAESSGTWTATAEIG